MIALLLALQVAAPAASTPATRQWVRKPTGQELAAVFPTKAKLLRVEGIGILTCSVAAGGTLSGCKVIAEVPYDYGFGAAALALAPYFLMSPVTPDGTPATSSATVRIPIRFKFGS